MPKINFHHEVGFTLIEVLISMIILALGLLGLASLQGISLKNNQDAFLFSQANALVYEMSDRIKANRLGWGAIPTAPASDCATSCSDAATSCSPAQMAASDYCYWLQKAVTTLSPNATVSIASSSATSSTVCAGSAPSLCLTMTWSRINQSLSTSMSTSRLQLEVTP